jgi:hypothetical protein
MVMSLGTLGDREKRSTATEKSGGCELYYL